MAMPWLYIFTSKSPIASDPLGSEEGKVEEFSAEKAVNDFCLCEHYPINRTLLHVITTMGNTAHFSSL